MAVGRPLAELAGDGAGLLDGAPEALDCGVDFRPSAGDRLARLPDYRRHEPFFPLLDAVGDGLEPLATLGNRRLSEAWLCVGGRSDRVACLFWIRGRDGLEDAPVGQVGDFDPLLAALPLPVDERSADDHRRS